jgi:4-diphosphocytidyl-2-C-methyl-D-erythritol kinase
MTRPAPDPRPPVSVTVRAHAKINLELRVGGVRPDGFHELETVFQALELHDTLRCDSGDGPFALECDAPAVPVDSSNLVWRAAAALWCRLGREGGPAGAVVRLEKRIPVQAGLGGGSADAAAALTGLASVWGAALGRDEVAAIAAGIGSDVAFFLTGGTALGLGRGERLIGLPELAPHWVVLVCPGYGVSTADAYRWYDAARPAARPAVPLDGSWALGDGPIRNDLEGPVARRHPEVAAARTALLDQGARAAGLSGSGSTVFGLFEALDTAEAAVASFDRGGNTGWRTILTRTLPRGG